MSVRCGWCRSRMASREWEQARGSAKVYEGLLSADATIPAGSCPSVGIAGLTLGGGLGYLGRKHGLTSDCLCGARLVLADGRIVDCDEGTEPDLFWALRGAGSGNFGVVTDLFFRTIPVPAVVSVFHLSWPWSDAGAVARAWLDWTPSAPDEIAASLDLRAGAIPDESLRVELFGTMLGTASDATRLLDDLVLRARADPAATVVDELSYHGMLRHWGERSHTRLDDPREQDEPRPYEFIKSEFFDRPLSDGALSAMIANLNDASPLVSYREIDFSPWGGAYNRIAAHATAFPHRSATNWLKHTARFDSPPSAAEKTAAHGWVNRSWAAVHGEGTGGVFPNFADPDLEDWATTYYGSNYPRLLEVKSRYDPDNIFRGRQTLPVAR